MTPTRRKEASEVRSGCAVRYNLVEVTAPSAIPVVATPLSEEMEVRTFVSPIQIANLVCRDHLKMREGKGLNSGAKSMHGYR